MGYALAACVIANVIELPLKVLLKNNSDLRVSMNEEENLQRKTAEKRLLIYHVIGLILSGMIATAAFIIANLFASAKATEETYHMMYTVSISFGWDIVILQLICAIIQVIVIRYVVSTDQQQEGEDGLFKRLAGAFVNKEITIARIS